LETNLNSTICCWDTKTIVFADFETKKKRWSLFIMPCDFNENHPFFRESGEHMEVLEPPWGANITETAHVLD
jgi:hypothetical protein